MALFHARAATTVVSAILHSLPTKFVRERMNGPRQALLVLLATIHSGIDRIGIRAAKLVVLDRLDAVLGWTTGKVPSTSAICRSLRKLAPAILESVIALAQTEVSRAYGPALLVHGRRQVAIDGVRINTRRQSILARWLGLPKQADDRQAHQPQALVVVARCVVSGVILDQEIVRHNGSERACARKLVARLAVRGPMLVVLDRGFPARDLIGLLIEHRIDFVVRMCGGKRAWRELHGQARGAAKDTWVPMHLRDGRGRWFTQNLRAILTAAPRRGRPRCNRKPQRLLLLTNLRGRYWSTARVVAAYHRRWDIETHFREDKRLLGATKSRATTKQGFRNELLALQIYRILMALVAAMALATAGVPRWDDPRAERLVASQLIQASWSLLVHALACPRECVEKILSLIHEIIRDAAKKRPNRTFKRECKGVEGAWKNKSDRGHG
jgi:Transposase DDE domain